MTPPGEPTSLRARAARIVLLALVSLPPLALWLGFADNVETPKRILIAGLGLVLAALTASSATARRRWLAAPMTAPCLGLAVAVLLSAGASGIPVIAWSGEEGSWMGAATLAAIPAFAALAGAWVTRGLARRLAAGLAGAATLSVVYEAAQAAGLDPMPWNPSLKGAYWLFAGLGNPVHLANVLVAAFWASFLLWPAAPGPAWFARAAWLAGAAATGERSVLVGLAGGGMIALMARGPTSPRGHRAGGPRPGRSRVILISIAAALVWLAVRETRLVSGLRLFGARPAIWEGALRLLRERPLLGAGPDLFYTRFPHVASYRFFVAEPPELLADSVRVRLPGSAHNDLIGWLAAVGVAGCGTYLWGLAVAWRRGRGSRLFPAAAALWCVHLVNPASMTTVLLFWLLLVAAGSRATGPDRPAPARAGLGVALLTVALLAASLASALREGVAQAHRREAGRLAFFDRRADLAVHLARWDGVAAGIHPRQAAEDAVLWRGLGDAARARALLDRARAANPENLFYASAVADLAMHRGGGGLAEAEAILREEVRQAPGVLSLYDDLADVLARSGRAAEAAALRGERGRLDPLSLFRAGKDRTHAAPRRRPPAE